MLHYVPRVSSPTEGYFDDNREVSVDQRMLKRGQVYYSLCYKRKANSVSFLVKFATEDDFEFGEVRFFLKECYNDAYAVDRMLENTHINISSQEMAPPRDPVVQG